MGGSGCRLAHQHSVGPTAAHMKMFFFRVVIIIFFGLFDLVTQKVLSLFVWRKRCTLRTILNEEDEECFVDSVQRAGGYFF